jgi:hypothetical protein
MEKRKRKEGDSLGFLVHFTLLLITMAIAAITMIMNVTIIATMMTGGIAWTGAAVAVGIGENVDNGVGVEDELEVDVGNGVGVGTTVEVGLLVGAGVGVDEAATARLTVFELAFVPSESVTWQ